MANSSTNPDDILNFIGLYRVQSLRFKEPGALRGKLVSFDNSLNSSLINEYLSNQPDWDGRARVSLRVIDADAREGAFSRHDDALYYESNFDCGGPSFDVLDLRKLEALAERRLPKLGTILSSQAVSAAAGALDGAVNEYMCHEAGHRLGYSINDKLAEAFFRRSGRLSWALIYMEEFRADIISWRVAMDLLNAGEAAKVVLFTLSHRFGLAIENMREGRPGAGFIPYLHYAVMTENGLLRRLRKGSSCIIDVDSDAASVVNAASRVIDDFRARISAVDTQRNRDVSAQAMLRYAVDWHERQDLISSFRNVMLG